MRKVIVIGGGAGGMMAALYAARAGAQVILLERNEKLGKKVYITGKGRCNVTNDCTIDEFMKEVPRNPRFLYSALSFLSPQGVMELLEDAGCPVVTQRGRRVFPATEKSSDVIRAFNRMLQQAGVDVRLNSRVKSVDQQDGRAAGVTLMNGEVLRGDAVILATGGKSYPMTGSTGDGYAFAMAAGHTIVKPAAVLSALETADEWPKRMQGVSLRNVTMTLKKGKKTLYTELGEMLFTHFGISGPLTLTASCHLPEELAEASLTLDLKPGMDLQQLDARVQRELEAQPRKQLLNVLPSLLPSRLAEEFPALCGVDGGKQCNQVTREEREKLCRMLKCLPIALKKLRPLDEAIVTRGGVAVKEIDPATMESRLLPGLYFAGEVMDVDAHTGGYNLQVAWSTGALAGQAAAEEPLSW